MEPEDGTIRVLYVDGEDALLEVSWSHLEDLYRDS